MKRWLVLSGVIFGFACGLHGQAATPAAGPAAGPVDASVCDVVKSPASFDGKMVRIKGTVVAGFDEFVIKDATDPNCGFQENGIWLEYPQGTKAKSGPAAMVTLQAAHNFAGSWKAPARTPVALDKSKEFKQFDSLLAQTHQSGLDMCLGCVRYEVTATLVGRLDGVADATLKREGGKIVGLGGFGNMNAYPARLVLESVSNVTPKEIDYAKSDAATAGSVVPTERVSGSITFDDPLASAQKLAAHIPAGPFSDQETRAIGAFPKQREQNGVNLVYGAGNEVPAEDAGAKDSPDGVLYTCTLNRDRLPGNALIVALFHVGQHVADLRSPKPGNEKAPVLIQENDAWVVTSIAAIVSGQKFLTLPGGYQLWNSSWPADSRDDKMAAALKDFLANEALLSQ